jgi:hypothetical protein
MLLLARSESMSDVRYVDVVELDNPAPTDCHALAEAFPLMLDDALNELANDITANGLRTPPILYEGLILDGRNRYQACAMAGIPITRIGVYQGDDPAGFVISQNVHRRHMSHGALAMATAKVLHAAGRRKNGRWVRGSVDISQSPNTASA